jgi:hypothetical protein
MALKSLGKVVVTTGGTEVRSTLNEPDQTARVGAQSFFVQQVTGNTGKIFVGSVGLDRITLAGVYAVLPAPTAGVLPSFSATVTESPAGFNMADIYIDADTNGESALVSFTEQ